MQLTAQEICPSSNAATLQLVDEPQGAAMRAHPTIGRWLEEGYPISVNTDDVGVFGSNSSAELFRVAEAFELSKVRVLDLACGAVLGAFLSEPGKDELRALIRSRGVWEMIRA